MTNLKIVVVFVGSVLLLSVIGVVALSLHGDSIPDVLQNLAVGALTGLVGLLVPGAKAQDTGGPE